MKIRNLFNAALPRLDFELIIASVLGQSREWVVSHPDLTVSEKEESGVNKSVTRRESGEPLAYIIGEKEFYGRTFEVNSSVLIPRPATEGLVKLAMDFVKDPNNEVRKTDKGVVCFSKMLVTQSRCNYNIVDIGTGSGCIAITLALELPEKKIIATDICPEALEVAKDNARRHGVLDRIDFRLGNLLEPAEDLDEPFLVVSNPPYIPDGDDLMDDVKDYEPHLALFGGKDGSDILRELLDQAENNKNCCGIVCECKEGQFVGCIKNLKSVFENRQILC